MPCHLDFRYLLQLVPGVFIKIKTSGLVFGRPVGEPHREQYGSMKLYEITYVVPNLYSIFRSWYK